MSGLVGPALSKLQTPEQLLAAHEALKQGGGVQAPDDGIDPDIAAEATHAVLDQHHRQCLNEPIPALDNKSPREYAKSKRRRESSIG